MVNSQGAVRVQLRAPGATSVQLDLGRRYEMTKDENGVWTGTSAPQDVGFHYYQLIVDGTAMPDPGTISYFEKTSPNGKALMICRNIWMHSSNIPCAIRLLNK